MSEVLEAEWSADDDAIFHDLTAKAMMEVQRVTDLAPEMEAEVMLNVAMNLGLVASASIVHRSDPSIYKNGGQDAVAAVALELWKKVGAAIATSNSETLGVNVHEAVRAFDAPAPQDGETQ